MLIICRECGGQISDEARICPFCGCPKENVNEQIELLKEIKKLRRSRRIAVIFAVTEFVFAAISLWAITQESSVGVLFFAMSAVLFCVFCVLSVVATMELKKTVNSSGYYVKDELDREKKKRQWFVIIVGILLILFGIYSAIHAGRFLG